METIYGIKGVKDLFPEEIKSEEAHIKPLKLTREDLFIHNLRNSDMFYIHPGSYVQLKVNGYLMMSDTGMERISNNEFIEKANGKVLIAGLGLGLIIQAIQDKPEVTEITVVEKYKGVIDLVAPKFPKVKIIHADIKELELSKDQKFDTIYFDIWPDICTDNLKEIKLLHAKFRKNLNKANPKKWMNSWMKEWLQNKERKEKRESYRYY